MAQYIYCPEMMTTMKKNTVAFELPPKPAALGLKNYATSGLKNTYPSGHPKTCGPRAKKLSNNIIYKKMTNINSIKDLSKDQLINLVLNQKQKIEKLFQIINKHQNNNKSERPIPLPRKSVKQMVQDYEENIILPPLEFRDDYKPIPEPRTKKPVPLPRTKIKQVDKALKGYTKSFEISIKHKKDPLFQLQNTRKAAEYHILKILTEMKGLKFVETLEVTFEKLANDRIVYKTAYFQ